MINVFYRVLVIPGRQIPDLVGVQIRISTHGVKGRKAKVNGPYTTAGGCRIRGSTEHQTVKEAEYQVLGWEITSKISKWR